MVPRTHMHEAEWRHVASRRPATMQHCSPKLIALIRLISQVHGTESM